MNWEEHSELQGKHSILSPSGYAWLNYSEEDSVEKIFNRMRSLYASDIGTIIHDYARARIQYRMPLNDFEQNDVSLELLKKNVPTYAFDIYEFYDTLKEYINDAISFSMSPERILYYSPNCFGTADAINYSKKLLRIHDLKTGKIPAHFEQLEIYAALFFLQYGKKLKIKPETTEIELRIYQLGEISVFKPETSDMYDIMDKIIKYDAKINQIKDGR